MIYLSRQAMNRLDLDNMIDERVEIFEFNIKL